MCKVISGENFTDPVKIIGIVCQFGKWTLEDVSGKTIESNRSREQIIWSVAPVSRIQVNWFFDEETVLQNKELPEVDATLVVALEFMFELERLFARVSRFWICSWEKIMLELLEFCSKTLVLFAVGNLWKFLAAVGVELNLFPLGLFHPGGYPISWKHLSTKWPE